MLASRDAVVLSGANPGISVRLRMRGVKDARTPEKPKSLDPSDPLPYPWQPNPEPEGSIIAALGTGVERVSALRTPGDLRS
jgi:hypothetical protein